MPSAIQVLKQITQPHLSLSESQLCALGRILRPVAAEPGATLFHRGDVCHEVIVLTRGLVRAFYIHEAREVNLRLLCAPAAVTAMTSLITGAPAQEWVAAITPVRGFRADFRDPALRAAPELFEPLHRVLAQQHYLALERRLYMLQWKSARERYAYFLAHMEPDVIAHTPGYHVASYLGVTPETLSRVRAAVD